MRIALQIYPQSYLAYNGFGSALIRQGRSGEAVAAFEAAERQWRPAPSGERQ